MATVCLSNTKSFVPSSSSSFSTSIIPKITTTKKQIIVCKAENVATCSPLVISKRSLSVSVASSLLFMLTGNGCLNANAAILEADEDDELMEKVKRDRKKRLERQGIISSSSKEKGYLQDLVYKLSKVGQAIEKEDLSAASSVLGQTTDAEWVQKVNSAFNKFSGSDEEKTEVDSFNSSLSSLVSSAPVPNPPKLDNFWRINTYLYTFLKSSSNINSQDYTVSTFNYIARTLLKCCCTRAKSSKTGQLLEDQHASLHIFEELEQHKLSRLVSKNDIEGSKTAFVASASAFEKWSTLTGLIEELKGL